MQTVERYGLDGRLGWRWGMAFVALALVAHEAHELGHTLAGRLVCGRWALRDFSVWAIPGCDSSWPAAWGPVVSYLLMGLGGWLAWHGPHTRQRVGLALLFAANPLARIITVASGHGDELNVARALAGSPVTTPAIQALALAVTVVLAGTAMLAGWRGSAGLRHRPAVFVLLMLAAILITGPGLGLINRALHAGVLTQRVAGAPALVHLVTLFSVAVLAASARWLQGGTRPADARAAVAVASPADWHPG